MDQDRIWLALEGRDPRFGRALAFAVQTLIVVSLISLCLQTLPDISAHSRWILELIEVATILLFAIEYSVRLWVSPNTRAYAFSPLGLVDLMAAFPALLFAFDFQAFRSIRLLRLLQLLKITRYDEAVRRIGQALIAVRTELALCLSFASAILFVAATGIYFFEHEAQPDVFASIPHALWWAVATLTTVGYGDIYPVTVGGKLFTGVVLLIGLGVVAIPTALFASAFTADRKREN